MEKRLGKIISIKFGLDENMLGLHLSLGNENWGVKDSNAIWDYERVKRTEYTQWTEEGRTESFIDLMKHISKLLKDAKVNSVDELKGIPIEVTFEGNLMREWRILTEVL